MKNFLYLVLISFVFIACKSKTQGCKDPLALNLDTIAEEQNNALCTYSTTTFYAGSTTVFGQPVEEITIKVNNVTIGTIDELGTTAPADCDQPGSLKYEFQTGQTQEWEATYLLVAGDEVVQQGDFSPDPQQACLAINVMP